MEELGKIHQLIVPLGEYKMHFNLEVIFFTWVVIALLILIAFITTRRRELVPGSSQLLGETVVGGLYGLTHDALNEKLAKKYAPLVAALFMFLVLCNSIGLIPFMQEPTKDLNVPLSLGIMGFFIAHYCGIREKGVKEYFKSYTTPFFIMLPLNLIGELAKVVSISFRLFGNIMGGAIIILVVSYLTYSILLPPFLFFFFGIFIGTIQAFVFTMLTIVYIAVQVN